MSDLNPNVEWIEINGKNYPIAYNLNVIDELQDRFQISIPEFVDKLLNDKSFSFKGIRALLYEMINEGIEILNDEGGNYAHIKEHTIGSMLTPQGIEQITCYAIAYTLNTLPKEDEDTPSRGLRSNNNA